MAEVEIPQPVPGPVSNENSAPVTSEEIKTVFHDVNNFNVKHPLLNTWSLWVSISQNLETHLLIILVSLRNRPRQRVITGMTC